MTGSNYRVMEHLSIATFPKIVYETFRSLIPTIIEGGPSQGAVSEKNRKFGEWDLIQEGIIFEDGGWRR